MTQARLKTKINPTTLPKFSRNPAATASIEQMLCSVLADTYRLMLNTQGLHWNGEGRAFFGLHKLTEEQYQELFGAIDELAERVRAMGHPAPQSFEALLELSTLDDIKPGAGINQQLGELAELNLALAKRIKTVITECEAIGDVGTADLLGTRVRIHEKAAWLLHSVMTA